MRHAAYGDPDKNIYRKLPALNVIQMDLVK